MDTTDRFVPVWEGSVFKAYARKYVGKNAWRVAKYMDYEDCMQTAAEVFVRCLRYETDNPAWFMGIFKRSLANEFHYYASECTLRRTAEADFIEEAKNNKVDVEIESASLSTIAMDASSELQQVLSVIVNAPAEFLGLLLKESDDSGWSRRLCRLCKIKTNEGIVAELRNLLNTHKGEGRVYAAQSLPESGG